MTTATDQISPTPPPVKAFTAADLEPFALFQRGRGWKPCLSMKGAPLGGSYFIWAGKEYLETEDEALDEADATRNCQIGSLMWEELQAKIAKARGQDECHECGQSEYKDVLRKVSS